MAKRNTKPECHLTVRTLGKDRDFNLSLPMPVEGLKEILSENEEYEIVDGEEIWVNGILSPYTNLVELNDFLIDASARVKKGFDFGKLLVVCAITNSDLFKGYELLNDFIFFDFPNEINEWSYANKYEKVTRFLLENARGLSSKLPENIKKNIFDFDGVKPALLDKRVLDYIDLESVWTCYETSGFGFSTSVFDIEYIYKELNFGDKKEV